MRLDDASGPKVEKRPAPDGSTPGPEPKPDSSNFQFERPDWVLFRSADTLAQKAGVSKYHLRQLVLKELVDNALDAVDDAGAGGAVKIGYVQDEEGCDDPDAFFVEDDGPGIGGTPEAIARMFSISRPLASSKLLRRPTRGALGNGLRVAMGTVAASNGWLTVWTRNKRLRLHPQHDGSTSVEATDVDFPTGTRIEIGFGRDIPRSSYNAMSWARQAIRMACGPVYKGTSSPWWYDGVSFFELLQAAGTRKVRDLVANLDGCSGARAGTIAAAYKNRACNSMSRADAVALLKVAREKAKQVAPERLGSVGPEWLGDGASYVVKRGTFQTGRDPQASVPFVVEAWVTGSLEGYSKAEFYINRTPITGDVAASSHDDWLSLNGCGLRDCVAIRKGCRYRVIVNIITPCCPVTTDGKEPDLRPFVGPVKVKDNYGDTYVKEDSLIRQAIEDAARKEIPKLIAAAKAAKAAKDDDDDDDEDEDEETPERRRSQKAIILANLQPALVKATDHGTKTALLRNLYYAVRPYVSEELGIELKYKNFCLIIADYEAEHGDIPGLYRDPRGTLYHPHTSQTIPLGTKAIQEYKRPAWTFNKILYIEKEGLAEVLKDSGWPERYDCALVSSKGFTTRAVKDLLDLLGDDGEPIKMFCVHDADASGTLIFQTLQEATKTRPRRNVEIINLGLEPWEGLELKLPTERVIRKKTKDEVPVADYVNDHPVPMNLGYETWAEWLKHKRIELDAMVVLDERFEGWLTRKMMAHGLTEKVIPPDDILRSQTSADVARHVRDKIEAQASIEARVEERIAARLAQITIPPGSYLSGCTRTWLGDNEQSPWRRFADKFASDLSEGRA